jgi:hypothetical protein
VLKAPSSKLEGGGDDRHRCSCISSHLCWSRVVLYVFTVCMGCTMPLVCMIGRDDGCLSERSLELSRFGLAQQSLPCEKKVARGERAENGRTENGRNH